MFAHPETVVPFALTVLLNALWQPLVLAAAVSCVLRILRKTNATTRHAIWAWALVAGVALPLATATAVTLVHVPSGRVTTVTASPLRSVAHRIVRESSTRSRPVEAAIEPAVSPRPKFTRPQFSLPRAGALLIVGAWLLFAVVVLGRLFVSVLHLERLKRDALPLALETRLRLNRWPDAPKGSREVRICVSDQINVPVAIGIFDSMILVPADLAHDLDGADLDRVLLHELAHLRRSDDWVNLFERIAEAVFFFSPGIHWISRQIDLEREVACDDWVLEQTQASLPYAQCLARIVEMTAWPHTALAAPGVFITRRSMSVRIERLLAHGRDARVRLALGPSDRVGRYCCSSLRSPEVLSRPRSPTRFKNKRFP